MLALLSWKRLLNSNECSEFLEGVRPHRMRSTFRSSKQSCNRGVKDDVDRFYLEHEWDGDSGNQSSHATEPDKCREKLKESVMALFDF